MRETTAKCSSSVPDVEGQEIQGLTWRGKQNPGFWMAFKESLLQHITEGRSYPSDNFQESAPNELHVSTHGETLEEGNTGKQGES